MATWDYTWTKSYFTSSGSDIGSGTSTGTLTDNDAGDTDFDTTETIDGGVDFLGFGSSGNFIGTVDVLGVTWVGIDQGNYTLFYGSPPPGTGAGDVSDGFETSFGSNLSDVTANLSNTSGFTTCFAAGTPIATPKGERAVETLAIGDLVLTADGGAVPVKWIGRQTVHKVFTPAERFRPVRIRQGALAENVPHADLVVTADHGILVDGIMVNAGALVNGTSIVRVPMDELADRVVYYHVETENHEVVLAAGAPAETYVDNVTRRGFDNFSEYEALFGPERRDVAELPYPRAQSRRQLPVRIREALEMRALALASADAKAA